MNGCNFDAVNSKNINIKSGIICVPNNWSLSDNDDLMYFYCDNQDSKDSIVAFQSNSYSTFKDDSNQPAGVVETNAISNQFQNLYTISSNVISNGVIYGEAMVSVDGSEHKMYYLDFNSDIQEVQLFVRPDKTTDKTIIKIAESFEPTEN